ncbi:hypothetical protein LWM68_26130 [Niabella sp. W65]|nr:hypothetical protein [Niabella sp. W65]MCH7365940.1 hypothetical protein [Niabella sp. W65]ULT41681.1 hypothetical protein KRR40_45035 [Niabella sp. I65]
MGTVAFAQQGYWQQKVKYVMDVNMNVQSNQFTGKQKLEYWNNSPDTLKKFLSFILECFPAGQYDG